MTSSTVRRTFLFTDIESSTRLWDRFPTAMLPALKQHDGLVRDAIVGVGGQVIRHTGDGFVAVFPSAGAGVDAALAAQRALATAEFPAIDRLKVRMGVHSGDVVERDGEYFGWALNVTARLHTLAHGGQIVVSGAAEADARRGMTLRAEFRDLGMHQLRDVAEPIRVSTVIADGLPDRFENVRGAARPVALFPRPPTRFVGRSREIERVGKQVLAHGLVTVVGLAGVGKTRLAMEVADAVGDRFVDGVVMCEFSGVSTKDVGAALANTLGVERRTLLSAQESVVEWLHGKELLLVLDNCEDAIDAIAELVGAVTRDASRCHMLATSREVLGVAGEYVTPLQPLPVEDVADDGVELFLERALAAGAELGDDKPTRMLARDVCRAVAGVPLAIEIAASNAAQLSLADVLDAVRSGELQAVGTSAGRHRTIEDALGVTFDRLERSLRDAFLGSAVLPGSFDRDAFAVVVAPDLDGKEVAGLLRSLVDRSLVVSETRSERTRFRLLDPVRAYARARLAPSDLQALQARVVRHYVEVAESVGVALRGPDEARCVARVELEFDNLRAAHGLALGSGDTESALRIVAALWDYAFMRMRSEIFDWGEAACAAASPDDPLQALVLGVVALGGWIRESPTKSEEFAAESLRIEREHNAPKSLPVRLAVLNAAEYGGEAADVRTVMREVIELSSDSASPYWQTNVDVVRSLGQSFAGRGDAALELANRAVMRARESQNPSTIAWALFGRAVATEPVDPEYAEALFDDGLVRARSVENRWIEALCTTRLASLRRRSSVRDAMTMVLELLDTWERAGHRSHLWSALRQAALCLAEAGDFATAVMLNEAAASAQLALPLLPADTEDLAKTFDALKDRVGEDQMRRWAARAAGLDHAEVTRIARDRLAAAIAG